MITLTPHEQRKLYEQVTFTVDCLPEDIPVKGNALASGDDVEDAKAEQWIYDELDAGNEWAWCCVKVTARWNGLEGTDFLGCCSYKSREDFERCDYYQDMHHIAFGNLMEQIGDLGDEIAKLSD